MSQLIHATLVGNCWQVREIDRHESRNHQVLKTRILVVLPLKVCIFCSKQNLCALFIFRTFFQLIDDPENEREAVGIPICAVH